MERYDNSFNSWIDKKDLKNIKIPYKNELIFPKPYDPFSGDSNVKVDLSNYATKADIKNISHVDTSSTCIKNKFS